jgi:hypothetical protein
VLAESLHAWASLVVLDSSVWVLFAARERASLHVTHNARRVSLVASRSLSFRRGDAVVTRVIPRAELERLDGDAATSHHLDGLLHELVAAHWLMPVPAQERPCCADGFLLRQDTEA